MLLFLQHPVLMLYLSRSSALVLPGDWGHLPVFVPVFQQQLLSHSSISEVWFLLRFQRSACGSPAILLWSWVFAVLVYWGLVSLPHPLSLGQVQRSVSQLPAVSVLWWFTECFSILQCHLALDVAQWLRRWALWTAIFPISGRSLSPAHCRPFCLSSLCLLKVCMEISSLPLPPSPVHSEHPAPSAACSFSVPCLLFCFSFFFAGWGVSLSRGLRWFWPGVPVGILCATCLLTCCSAGCLQSRFDAGDWQCGSPPVFSV
jgi:hypothetical protein